MTQPAAGWYPDPSGDTSKIRYWDGNQWTDQVRDNAAQPAGGTPVVQPASGIPVAQPVYQQPAPGYQQPQPVQAPYSNVPVAPYMQPQAPVKDKANLAQAGFYCAISGLAVSILLLVLQMAEIGNSFTSILFILCFGLTIPAVILGIMGIKSSKQGLAIAALVLGVLGILAFLFFLWIAIQLIQGGLVY
jgi:hypothetical protein